MPKAEITNYGHHSYAVKVNGLDSTRYFTMPFGHSLPDREKIRDFQARAKTYHVGAKGKATLQAVRNWIKEKKPSEFFAQWMRDSTTWKDDSVCVWYLD